MGGVAGKGDDGAVRKLEGRRPHAEPRAHGHNGDALTQNGWIGRELPRLFADAGLTDILVKPEPIHTTDYDVVAQGTGLERRATAAATAGVISEADAQPWLTDLVALRDSGRFWWAMLLFTVRGRKPA